MVGALIAYSKFKDVGQILSNPMIEGGRNKRIKILVQSHQKSRHHHDSMPGVVLILKIEYVLEFLVHNMGAGSAMLLIYCD